MMLTKSQLCGLEEVLPQGYPSQGGVIVLLDRKPHSRSSKRRRSRSKKAQFVPWYQRNGWWI